MTTDGSDAHMIMRLFHVRTKPGTAAKLVEKFASTSVDVVQHEPGNTGYFFGAGIEADKDVVVFASFWSSLNAIKVRFGEDWQEAFLPEGYEDLIEACSVEHIDVGAGWSVRKDP